MLSLALHPYRSRLWPAPPVGMRPTPAAPLVAAATPRMRALSTLSMSLVLTEENAALVLDQCMVELGTIFGSNAESLNVGM